MRMLEPSATTTPTQMLTLIETDKPSVHPTARLTQMPTSTWKAMPNETAPPTSSWTAMRTQKPTRMATTTVS